MAIAALMGLPVSGATALAPTDAGPPSTPLERVQALVQPAVVYEKVTWTAWAYDATNQGYFTDKPFTVSFQCTGFVVNPSGYIATAGHCVEYSDAVAAALARQVAQWAYENQYYQARPPLDTILTFAKNWRLVGKSKTGEPDLGVEVAYGVSVSGEETGKALQARVVGSRPKAEGDVALLKIDAKNLTVLPLSSNENVGVGTQVVSVGYPMSVDLVTDQTFDPSFKEGSISAEKTTKGGLYPVYEISSAVSGGMSGGPTTSLSGQAIGVNSFGIAGETQQFNFVQSSKTLEELMRSEGVPNELGQVTDLYRSGLNAYFAGDREASILAFDGVIEIVPTHEFAQKYRTKAKELPEQKKILGMPILTAALVVAAVLVVVVVVVAVVLILLSKRRKSATQPTVQPPFPPTLPGGGNEPPGGAPPNPPESPPPPPEGIPPAQAAPPPEPTEVPPGTGEPVAPPQEPIPADEGQPAPPAAEAGAKHFCPNCGSPHAQGARFCENCGGPL